MFYLLDKCLKVKIHKILGRQTNVYIFTTMQILLFQAYCKHNIRLKLEKHAEVDPKKHYAYKKFSKVFSASSTCTNILIWKYLNEQIF